MDISKYTESGLSIPYVKSSPSKKCVILNGGVPKVMPDGKEKVVFLVEIDSKTMTWTPNKTTLKNLENTFGIETSKWIGRPITLEIGTINGKEAVVGKPQQLP